MMQPPPLRLTSSRAFPYAADDLLALAGEALSGIWRFDGRMMWQFPQGVMRRPPPEQASFFTALATYTTGDYDGGGTMQHWVASVQLTVTATGFERDGQYYCSYTLDATGANGGSAFEIIIVVACVHLARRLLERQWIADDQAAGFWRLAGRGWSDMFLVQALRGGEFNLMWALQKQGLFPEVTVHDPNIAMQAMAKTLWMRRLFDR